MYDEGVMEWAIASQPRDRQFYH